MRTQSRDGFDSRSTLCSTADERNLLPAYEMSGCDARPFANVRLQFARRNDYDVVSQPDR